MFVNNELFYVVKFGNVGQEIFLDAPSAQKRARRYNTAIRQHAAGRPIKAGVLAKIEGYLVGTASKADFALVAGCATVQWIDKATVRPSKVLAEV
jgi:hypothetical protein